MELLKLPFKEESKHDVHAPAETYYTTGSNDGHAITRFRTFSVSYIQIEKIFTPHTKFTF